MRVLFILFCIATTSLFAAPPKIGSEVVQAIESDASVDVIVMLRETRTSHRIAAEAVIRETPSMKVTCRWNHVRGFAATIGRDALAALEANPDVLKVDVDSGGHAGLAQSIPLIGANITHNLGYTGRGVAIAVVDSGADLTHPDLRDAITGEACFCGGCCPNGSSTQFGAGAGRDENGHGTNVAGIALSRGNVSAKGVAPDASLVVVRVLDRNGSFANSSQVVSGLDWVLTNHPEVRVVNMSLLTNAHFDGYCDTTNAFTMAFASVIDRMRAAGMSVFACSGNTSNLVQLPAPACVRNALSVGAVYDANVGPVSIFTCSDPTTAADQVTCFSSTNATLDLLGPGAPITSDGLNGGLSTYYGTSQATPHAAGAAAVLLGINPTLTPADIEQILENTGKPIRDNRTGQTTPRIDVAAAAQATPKPVYGPRRRAVRK